MEQKKDYRIVGIKRGKKKLFYREILYIQKASKGGKYVEYVTIDGTYRERIALGKLLEELSDPRFMLVDRGHVMNVQHIERMENGVIYLTSGEEFPVSRVQLAKVKHQILEYLEGV